MIDGICVLCGGEFDYIDDCTPLCLECDPDGFYNRPVKNCGHVGSDGCCNHPRGTVECHQGVPCPMTAEAIKERSDKEWSDWIEANESAREADEAKCKGLDRDERK